MEHKGNPNLLRVRPIGGQGQPNAPRQAFVKAAYQSASSQSLPSTIAIDTSSPLPYDDGDYQVSFVEAPGPHNARSYRKIPAVDLLLTDPNFNLIRAVAMPESEMGEDDQNRMSDTSSVASQQLNPDESAEQYELADSDEVYLLGLEGPAASDVSAHSVEALQQERVVQSYTKNS